MFSRVDKKKKMLDSIRPFPGDKMKNLKAYFDLQLTYNSNAIEGSGLTPAEVRSVIEKGVATGKGKVLREYLEAAYHKEAIDYLETMVENNRDLSEEMVKGLHYIMFDNTGNDRAGKYRDVNVVYGNGVLGSSEGLTVSRKISELLAWYRHNKGTLHPVELAAVFHCKFIHSYPFIYGNGRVGRLLMNLILMKSGYPPAVIKVEDKAKYSECMETANIYEDYNDLVQLIAEAVDKSLDAYLVVLF